MDAKNIEQAKYEVKEAEEKVAKAEEKVVSAIRTRDEAKQKYDTAKAENKEEKDHTKRKWDEAQRAVDAAERGRDGAEADLKSAREYRGMLELCVCVVSCFYKCLRQLIQSQMLNSKSVMHVSFIYFVRTLQFIRMFLCRPATGRLPAVSRSQR